MRVLLRWVRQTARRLIPAVRNSAVLSPVQGTRVARRVGMVRALRGQKRELAVVDGERLSDLVLSLLGLLFRLALFHALAWVGLGSWIIGGLDGVLFYTYLGVGQSSSWLTLSHVNMDQFC